MQKEYENVTDWKKKWQDSGRKPRRVDIVSLHLSLANMMNLNLTEKDFFQKHTVLNNVISQ